MTPTS
ncbi:unnamed protein product [Cuscuta europaea]